MQPPLKCSWSHRPLVCTLTWVWAQWCFEELCKKKRKKRRLSTAGIDHSRIRVTRTTRSQLSAGIYIRSSNHESIITLQGRGHESWGRSLCLVQIEGLLATALTKTSVLKKEFKIKINWNGQWAGTFLRITFCLPWKSSEKDFLPFRTADQQLQHNWESCIFSVIVKKKSPLIWNACENETLLFFKGCPYNFSQFQHIIFQSVVVSEPGQVPPPPEVLLR